MTRPLRYIPTIALLAALAACGAPASTSTQAGVEAALTAAEKAALTYKNLPACPAAALCSDPAAVVKILAADNVAYAAVLDMRAGKMPPDIAAARVAALVALVPVK